MIPNPIRCMKSKGLWSLKLLDKNGYRSNVAIILSDGKGRVLLAKRIGQASWQFPQGGIDSNEIPREALYRELNEEVGLDQSDVEVLQESRQWLKYRIPRNMQRKRTKPICVGQKQKWFFLKLLADESRIKLDMTDSPEFDEWQWVNYWYPLTAVIAFKQKVYQQALQEFAKINSAMEKNLTV